MEENDDIKNIRAIIQSISFRLSEANAEPRQITTALLETAFDLMLAEVEDTEETRKMFLAVADVVARDTLHDLAGK